MPGGAGRCHTLDVDELPVLWVAMEARRRALGLGPGALHHEKTRAKIKRGIICRDDVYDNLDNTLGWQPGAAKRAALQHIPPRLKERRPDEAADRRLRKLTLVSGLNRVAAMIADSPDDVPEDVLKDAERKVREMAERIRGGGTGTNSQQRQR